MSDPLKDLIQLTVKANQFPPNSRYHGIEVAKMELTYGRTVAYLRRRFIPPPERFALLQEHTACQGERLDNIAAKYIVDPEQFWRICDANGAMGPEELTEAPGRRLRITMPEGIPGPEND